MDGITERFNRLEQSIATDINHIERRLSQLVNLVKNVSAMQQQVQATQAQIAKLRVDMQHCMEFVDVTLANADTANTDRIKRLTQALTDIDASVAALETDFKERFEKAEYNQRKWLNRGIGAFLVASTLFGIFQLIGSSYLEAAKEEREAARAALQLVIQQQQTLEERQTQFEEHLRKLRHASANKHE